ncbi:uncharacterized protein LOC128292635, partial [Gossypium arboreum]|uniref:uncharacterized protein LOC128292635 n=1 Tax=Gossypium arboreum TaxID=29729 RepID=UPI0022F1A664
ITYPTMDTDFELKSGLIQLLPTFRGLQNENPHKHLKEFHMVCRSMKPQGVTEDQIKLRAFPFSLVDSAKEWLFYLPPGSITTWADLSRLFLNRFFPASRAVELRREIMRIRQKDTESLYDYWERFKKLYASFPQHGITEQSLLQYFYEGLKPMEMNMVDAASGGALVNMTPQQARDLISTMATNSQQKAKTTRLCGICATPEHTTDACPSLNDDTMAHLNAKTEASIRELTTSIEKMNSQGKLPSQIEPNPRQNANAVTLRSRKVLEPIPGRNLGQESAQEKPKKDEQVPAKPSLPKIQPPFPGRLNQCRKSKKDKEIFETFRNVEINLPLLDAIRQIPRYAKFLKELCTNKRKLTGNEKVSVGENVSAVLQRKMPVKCKDRGMFAIPCKIGHLGIKKAMCDLGASINVMPFSIYESLNASFLTKTGVTIQLADRSIVHPEGVLEDVLVKVNRLIFPADFYVIKMDEDNAPLSSDILLGRPFLSTANTKIDVRSGTLTMEFDREIVKFNVYGTISHPSEVLNVNRVDIVAYKLALPPAARIHPTFHVSQLKKHIGSAVSVPTLPPVESDGALLKTAVRILDRHLVKQGNHAAVEVLV